MAAELEILGVTKVDQVDGWEQPRDEVVDVSAFTEAAIMCTVLDGTVASGTTHVFLDTAVTNAEERWIQIATLCSYTVNPSAPDTHYIYLQGPGGGIMGAPNSPGIQGFGKYLRVAVEQTPGSELVLDVRAIMKP